MLRKFKRVIPFIAPALSLAVPAAAMAEQLVPAELVNTNNIVVVIRSIIRFILLIAFVIAFIMLLVGGIRWILAGGDEKSVEKARNTITAALIGLVVILVAYALIRLVETFFNVSIISGRDFRVPVVEQPTQ
ncbi:hypothetical protein HY024_00645 [Candidatus Curtissbacteria bacterium]|nr:hypothetical protein [Candidatus Curtissbacteria bacterium]